MLDYRNNLTKDISKVSEMTLALLNEIKIEIRSLLISTPNGLREDELCRDYALFNSKRVIPYQLFGYLTIKDFLNSLTDILYRSSDGCIHPVVDQSTAHIFKLVQQQRKKKKTKQRPVSYNQQEYKYVKQSKPSNSRNQHKRITPSIISSSQQIYSTVDAIKPVPISKQMKMTYGNNIKKDGPSTRLKPSNNTSSLKVERINVTNEFLQNLLIHFQRQQQK